MISRCILNVLLYLVVATGTVEAGTRTISLVLTDLDSLTAIEALGRLRGDPLLDGIDVRVYAASQLKTAEPTPLLRSELILAQITGRTILREGGELLKAAAVKGAVISAVGLSFDDDFADYGLRRDDALKAYMSAGGAENLANMIRAAVVRLSGSTQTVEPPKPQPDFGYYDIRSGRVFADFEQYRAAYAGYDPQKPWLAILFYRSSVLSGQTATLRLLGEALERRNYNVLPVFGYPYETVVETLLLDPAGHSRVDGVAALALKIGATPDKTIPVLERLGVPVVNGIALNSQSAAQWTASKAGLDPMERAWQIAGPEFAGAVAPTVVAAKEMQRDPDTGQVFVREVPIPERVERYAARLAAWASLRHTANADKRVALIYYNYPPGKENIGASYLNVLPGSLRNLIGRLRQEGYTVEGAPVDDALLKQEITQHGVNIGNWAPGAIKAAVRSKRAVLLAVDEYKAWFDGLPKPFRDEMIRAWGRPEKSRIGIWKEADGRAYFVLPALRYGNLLLAPQPSRGWEQDVKKLYHDVSVPPHHQYVAFYLWLQKRFGAHAMIHLGTHATHEWLSGKEVGFTAADPGDLLMGDVPQIYPYVMDNVGEGLQAKRRGLALLISHMTPPMDKAGLDPALAKLAAAIDDYNVAMQKSPESGALQKDEINRLYAATGLTKDLGKARVETDEDMEELEHYLKEIREKRSPMGLHTFGQAASAEYREKTADAILSRMPEVSDAERPKRKQRFEQLLHDSASAEMDAVASALSGRYIAAGSGGDPLRNPDALPTGKDLYGFDPTRLPSEAVYREGARLADQLVADHGKAHGKPPERLIFNLWGVESSRHEGVIEAEILRLLGVRPRWDERGRAQGVEVIPRTELGRPRVDVTIIPSGLYRDLFAPVILLLDKAVTAAQQQDEPDNPLRKHIEETRKELIRRGLAAREAEDLAAARLFSVPSGAYGTNLDRAIPLSNTWTDEKQLADVFFMRMHHIYGRGRWGDAATADGRLAVDLFKLSLKNADAVVHSRSGNLYASLDGDDFYQYLGGTAMAARAVNGKTPDVLVADLSDPRNARHESLARYQGREMRARYLNPRWIDAMLKEGYAGARFVNMVVENLWGWQVTVPEAVGAERWQAFYETYVEDRYQLDIRKKFEEAGNLLAYQSLVDRMLTAINKGYWKAPPEVKATLEQINREVIAKAGVACNRDTCSSPEITRIAEKQDRQLAESAKAPAPGTLKDVAPPAGQNAAAKAAPPVNAAPAAATPSKSAAQTFDGYEMVEKSRTQPDKAQAQPPGNSAQTWLLALGFWALFGAGYWRGARSREAGAEA